MRALTLDDALRMRDKYLGRIAEEKQKAFQQAHSQNVATLAALLAEKKHADKEVLAIAGIVHDIGRAVAGEDHAKQSVELLEQEGFAVEGVLRDCILNHGLKAEPQTREGKLLQAADKLSLLDLETLKIILGPEASIQEQDILFVEKMAKKSVECLRRLDQI